MVRDAIDDAYLSHTVDADVTNPTHTYSCVQFMPAIGATPDPKNHTYCILNPLGAFDTEELATEFAQTLQRQVQCNEPIFVTEMGTFKPLTLNQQYTGDPERVAPVTSDGDTEETRTRIADPTAFPELIAEGIDTDNITGNVRDYKGYTIDRMRAAEAGLGRKSNALNVVQGATQCGDLTHQAGSGSGSGRGRGTDTNPSVESSTLGSKKQQLQALHDHTRSVTELLTVDDPEQTTALIDELGDRYADACTEFEMYESALAILQQYQECRMKYALARSKLSTIDARRTEAVTGEDRAVGRLVNAHTEKPSLKDDWVRMYAKTLKETGQQLDENDRYCVMRYCTRPEWDEAPLRLHAELMRHRRATAFNALQGGTPIVCQ
jgi:hypothetical protein